MSGSADTLKEFLISIGFSVDAGSEARFTAAIAGATLKAIELGASAEAAATAVVAMVAKIAGSMEQLYYASQRTHASVENIQAIGFAAAQMGSSVEAARSSLEGFANFLRSSPGAASLVESLGVKVYSGGKERDSTNILQDLGAKFANMPIYLAQKYAATMGIDQNTLFALINGLGQLSTAYKQMWQAAGLDSTGGSYQAHTFMVQLRELGAAFDILGIKIQASLAGALGGDIEQFRELIVANFGSISDMITYVARGVLAFAELFVGVITVWIKFFQQLKQDFDKLNPQTKQWIELLGGLLVAWKLLNLAFETSPLGIILLVGSALLLLYQDYQTWKAGGKSLIDWKQWQPDIEKFQKFITDLSQHINAIVQSIGGWQVVFAAFLSYFMVTWSAAIIGRLATILAMMAGVVGGGIKGTAAGIGSVIAGDASAIGLAALKVGSALGVAGYVFFGGQGTGAGVSASWGEDQAQFQPYGKNPKAQQIRDFLMSNYGWSQAAADGIVANLSVETGGTFDPATVGDNGAAYGIGQWHADRQANFQKMFHKPIQGSSLGEQLAFYNAELRGRGGDTGAAGVGAFLNKVGVTASQAGMAISQGDERPADVMGNMIKRGSLATSIQNSYPNGPASLVINQKTIITAPSSVTAKQLADHQGRVNGRLVRNLKGAHR